jgi:hypothetical protein
VTAGWAIAGAIGKATLQPAFASSALRIMESSLATPNGFLNGVTNAVDVASRPAVEDGSEDDIGPVRGYGNLTYQPGSYIPAPPPAPPQPIGGGHPAPAHSRSIPLPRVIVCGRDVCVEVTRGAVEVSSTKTQIRDLRVEHRNGRPNVVYRTGRGSVITDQTPFGVLGTFPDQTGQNQAHGSRYHALGGAKIDTRDERATVQTRAGERSVVPRDSRADAKVLTGQHGDVTGYQLTAKTTVHLPDGTSVTESVHVTLKYVKNTFDFKGGRPSWGELKEPIGSGTGSLGSAQARAFAEIAAHQLARSSYLAIDQEPPGGKSEPQQPGWDRH